MESQHNERYRVYSIICAMMNSLRVRKRYLTQMQGKVLQ